MFRSLLAYLTGTNSDASVLALSLRVANAQAGHIECLRVRPDLDSVATQIDQLGMAGWITLTDRLTELEQEAGERSRSAKANFDAFRHEARLEISSEPGSSQSVSTGFREDTGEEVDRILRLSRYYDAVVLAGGFNATGRLSEAALGAMIMGSGRPVLLAPETQTAGPFARIAIAWKDTAEAARSLTAAMPLLEQAKQIELICAEEGEAKRHERVAAYENILRYFRWHGFNAKGHFVTAGARTAAEAVLDHVQDAGTDLLVTGAYGHSRQREYIFGGFTEHLLKGAAIPVLLFH